MVGGHGKNKGPGAQVLLHAEAFPFLFRKEQGTAFGAADLKYGLKKRTVDLLVARERSHAPAEVGEDLAPVIFGTAAKEHSSPLQTWERPSGCDSRAVENLLKRRFHPLFLQPDIIFTENPIKE